MARSSTRAKIKMKITLLERAYYVNYNKLNSRSTVLQSMDLSIATTPVAETVNDFAFLASSKG